MRAASATLAPPLDAASIEVSSCARSSLPVGVSGSVSRNTTDEGTMYLGQPLAEVPADAGGGGDAWRLERHAGGELGAAGLRLAHDHRGLAHARERGQSSFDLPQFHPVASHLDLPIPSSEELDRCVGTPAREVAGAIQPRARRLRDEVVGHALGRQLRPAKIAARDAAPPDRYLAANANRYRLAVVVEDVDSGCRRWAGQS